MNEPTHSTSLPAKRIPGATYRLQFNRDFTFQQAGEILEYLRELGVMDVYASPLFQAGPESTHGYDICCFGKINPNIGTEEDFERFNARRHELGLGLLLDMVPNHMGATLSNGWWFDVLENGPESKYASFFDIKWQPENPALKNKVLLPVLGDHYGKVLESGQLQLGWENEKFFIGYYERKFPLSASSIRQLANAGVEIQKILAEFNGRPGEPRSFDRLHRLIQQQHYRLAFWRVGSEEINYRRFFDVTELVSLRMELPEVFAASHKFVFDWLKAGKITGLRIDHPDGLRDPKQYFERLQSRAAECAGISQGLKFEEPLYIAAEKILSGDEALPHDWPVDGTTGYDFLNRLNGLFVNRANEPAFDQIYEEVLAGKLESSPAAPQGSITDSKPELSRGNPKSGSHDFRSLRQRSKKQILETSLISELDSLTHRLQAVAMNTRTGMDFTFGQLKSALKELIAAFPVYRTYLTAQTTQPSPADRIVIEKAVAEAWSEASGLEPGIFEFLGKLLTLELLPEWDASAAELAREFVLRFQQLTGPVMAKGLEDTAFYNYNRLISLNEVGGEPDRFGCSVEEFHNANVTVAARWPHTLLATATHDTKRGEDARARINVLSELPDEWRQAVSRWSQWNANKKTSLNGVSAPTLNDEYLWYQSLVGALLTEAGGTDGWADFRKRAGAFLLKAIREAKANTSWLQPNIAYETAVQEFTERVLAGNSENLFLDDLHAFTRRIAFFGRFNSLAQTLLKITSPGVPDFYQGAELWDLSFVDPDNRRPVDFELRRQLLTELKRDFEISPPQFAAQLLERDSESAKLFVIWRSLDLRKRWRGVFDKGAYTPLPAMGSRKDHVCAFGRAWEKNSVLTVVPRLVCGLVQGKEVLPMGLPVWGETFLPLPKAREGDGFRDIFTNEILRVEGGNIPHLKLGNILRAFPVALLESV